MIEVKEPSGKLISHTEFENSLYTPAYPNTTPSGYLSRTFTQGEWGIISERKPDTLLRRSPLPLQPALHICAPSSHLGAHFAFSQKSSSGRNRAPELCGRPKLRLFRTSNRYGLFRQFNSDRERGCCEARERFPSAIHRSFRILR